MNEVATPGARRHEKYERLIAAARARSAPIPSAVAHPCDESSLGGAVEAAEAGLIVPILVGPGAQDPWPWREQAGLDIAPFELVDAPHSHAAAAKAVELVRAGQAELLMKGSLHTDELMGEVVRQGDRPAHRAPDQPRLHHGRADLSRAAVHHRRRDQHLPRPRDQGRHRPERDRPASRRSGSGEPRGRDPVGGRDGQPEDPGDARGRGAVQDGRPRPDHRRRCSTARWRSTTRSARRRRGSRASSRRWRARRDILVVPDLEAGNMLAKNLSFLANADAAGIVLGARVPIILTSRADNVAHAHGVLRGGGALRPSPRRDSAAMAAHERCRTRILVLNAGSSSIKFQLFDVVGGDGSSWLLKGQLEGIGTHAAPHRPRTPRARAVDRDVRRRPRSPDVAGGARPARRLAARARSAALAGRASATASCMAAPTTPRRCWSTTRSWSELERARAAGAAAPAEQPRADPRDPRAPARACRRSPASTPPSTAATPRSPTGYAIPDSSTRRASAATASTACPTSTSPHACREVAPELAGGPGGGRPSGQRRSACARIAGGPQRRQHDGLHRARRPADGHPLRPARPRRRALPAARQGHGRRRDRAPALPRLRPEGPVRASATTCATCWPATSPRAALAIDYFVYRIARELGALAAALGGLDGLVFTAGIGEHAAADPRPRSVERLRLARRRARRGANAAHGAADLDRGQPARRPTSSRPTRN